MKKIFSFLFVLVILIYQKVISPILPSTCRFFPTCSEYGKQVIIKHGPFKGGYFVKKKNI